MKPGSENVEIWIESAVTPGSVAGLERLAVGRALAEHAEVAEGAGVEPFALGCGRRARRFRPLSPFVDSESRPHAATTRHQHARQCEHAESLHRSPSSANCCRSPARPEPDPRALRREPDAPSDPARETAVSHARVQAAAVCHQELAVSGQAAPGGPPIRSEPVLRGDIEPPGRPAGIADRGATEGCRVQRCRV